MPFHKGFRATIYDSTTSIPLTEYAPFIDHTTDTVTSYIQTTADQPFTIILQDTLSTFSQGTAVYVDGVYVDNGLTGPGIATERRWFGKRIDHIHVRPFIFRTNPSGWPSNAWPGVTDVDDSMIADDARIGTISLLLRRCQISGIAEDQSNRGCIPDDSEPPNIRHLTSRSDYLAHRAEYQSPKSIPATLYHVQWLDSQNSPAYLEFKFIYRSKEVLISKGILPSSSTPLPVRDESTLAPFPSLLKKRKSRSENTTTTKRKSSAKAAAGVGPPPPPSSPTTVEATPPKPARAPKKHRASTKTQVKKETEVKTEIDVQEWGFPPDTKNESPGMMAGGAGEGPSSDAPVGTMIEVLSQPQQQRQVVSHPGHRVLHNTVVPWVESQSATIEVPVDIFRELRELRDEVKRLKEAQGPPAPTQQMVSPFPGMNPYHPFTGHSTASQMGFSGNSRESWDSYYPGAGDVSHPHSGDSTQAEHRQQQQ